MNTKKKLTFQELLKFGVEGEKEVCEHLLQTGASVMPYFQFEDINKAPRIFSLTEDLISPDLIVFQNGMTTFVECKKKNQWVRGYRPDIETGLNNKHFLEYYNISIRTQIPFEIYFVHVGEEPTGIWKIYIDPKTFKLIDYENGRRFEYVTISGIPTPMTFFQKKDLIKIN